jgi:predicted dehydrogenase
LEVPAPHFGPSDLLISARYSLISSGTEMSTVAKTPTELVRQTVSDPWMRHVVKQTVFATGLGQTARRVWQEMITPREIGYSGAGVVVGIGDEVEGFELGQPVAYAASGHAEFAAPSINHAVAVPAEVDLRQAAFVTVGGIAMQSLRRAEPQFGETVAIVGLGLVGQLCARLARTAGCVVVGIDVSERANQLALEAGASLVVNPTEPEWKRRILDFTNKQGVDATIICASSDSADVINASMEITRRQGRVVVVGYVKLDIHPKNFLYNEIDLRYSRAYGPGSYDTGYEAGRIDYPFGYVRWTEKRNLEEFIRLLASGAVGVEPLIAGEFAVEDAQAAFDAIRERRLPGVAALLSYATDASPQRCVEYRPRPKRDGKVGLSLIGFGNHVLSKHLPNIRRMRDVELRAIASATGRHATVMAEGLGATMVTTDVDALLADRDTDAVMICSSQPEHYGHIRRALDAGKAVFVEKPLVTRAEDFGDLLRSTAGGSHLITLGLNRRYSPMVGSLRAAVPGPIDFVQYVITQPFVPRDHWTLDPVEGGGRLITEGEHFIDLCSLLVERSPVSVTARALGTAPDDLRTLCNFVITLHYPGAVASIVFNESGAPHFPRERLTALGRGRVAILDDFAKLTVHGQEVDRKGAGLRKSMGHAEELEQFVLAVQGRPNHLLSWEDASNATLAMFAAQESIRTGAQVDLSDYREALLHPDTEAVGRPDDASAVTGVSGA